ncbi:MAG: hypothetical protein R2777_05375 [Chitinophagales bacterium]
MLGQIGFFGLFIMALIFVLSVITVYITIERYTAIKKAGNIDENFMNRVKKTLWRMAI